MPIFCLDLQYQAIGLPKKHPKPSPLGTECSHPVVGLRTGYWNPNDSVEPLRAQSSDSFLQTPMMWHCMNNVFGHPFHPEKLQTFLP